MVILKTSTKYRKFFPKLVIKTTDFRLVFNFEQTRTFTIFGEHGIIPWAHTICVCNRLLFYSKLYWIYRLFYLQRYITINDYKRPLILSYFLLVFNKSCLNLANWLILRNLYSCRVDGSRSPFPVVASARRLGGWDKKIRRQLMLIPPSGRPSCTFFRSPQPHKARKGRRRPGERGRHEECHGINYDFWLGQWQCYYVFLVFILLVCETFRFQKLLCASWKSEE